MLGGIVAFLILGVHEPHMVRYDEKLFGSEAIEELHEVLYPVDSPDRTEAVFVLHKSKPVYESYAEKFDEQTPHILWSVSKTVSGLLLGIAVKEQRVQMQQDLGELFPDLAGKGLSLEDVFYWSSGIRWQETYEHNPIGSSVIQMLYGVGRDDMSAYVRSLGFKHRPGSHFHYSSGDTNLMMAVLQKKMSAKEFERYPFEKLFKPLEINRVVWERDPKNLWGGASFLYLTAPDLAKIGQLYLDQGVYQGQQIVDAEWIHYSTRPAPAFWEKKQARKLNDLYPGGHWWLNREDPERGLARPLPDVPTDAFVAQGHWGQFLYVVPSQDLVAVRLGNDRQSRFDDNLFVSRLIDLLRRAAANQVVEAKGDALSGGSSGD